MKSIREKYRFYGEPKDEILEGGRYTLRYQAIDDRKHPDQVKAQGDTFPILVEVFDREELTYQIIYGVRNDAERRDILEMTRREIARGEHTAQKLR